MKDFATTIRDDLFAGTPELEAVKLIFSLVASLRGGLAPQKRIMVMDVKGAFLHAALRRKVCFNLPEEATRRRQGRDGRTEARDVWHEGRASVLAGKCQGSDGGAGVRGREGEPVRLSAQDSQSCHFGSC